jgi:DNA-binding beta-propeller fold protein YncE
MADNINTNGIIFSPDDKTLYVTNGGTIVAFDPSTGRAYVLNTIGNTIDIVSISASGVVNLVSSIDLTTLDGFGGANSVAIKNGILAVAYASDLPGADGSVALFDANGALINTVEVGTGPDQVVFTADGLKLLVANEGEPVTITLPGGGSQLINPEGSVSIIDLRRRGKRCGFHHDCVRPARRFRGDAEAGRRRAVDRPDGLGGHRARVHHGVAGWHARYVTLQEVNAVAVIDLTDPAATKPLAILPLGGVDHNLAGNKFDASDRDGPSNGPAINLRNADVISLLQPDSIASFKVGSDTYFVTAKRATPAWNSTTRPRWRNRAAAYSPSTSTIPPIR